MVGFGSDGASVMMGKKGGVVAKLKEIQPCLQGIHCFAHRLELAYKDAIKGVTFYPRMNTLLTGLYYFYHNSPLNRQNLKRSFDALNKAPLMPTRVSGTRWLPHTERALENFWGGYTAIKTHLEQLPSQKGASADALGKAKGFMSDVVTLLSKLSLMFQATTASVTDIKQKLDATTTILNKYKTKDGPRLRHLNDISTLTGLDFGVETSIKTVQEKIASSLISCLENRFSDALDGVIAACKIADFKVWPVHDTSSDFGDDEVSVLVDHFKPVLEDAGIDVVAVEQEWDILKTCVYKSYKDVSVLDWSTINRRMTDCKNILALIDLILTIPAHSADAERGFSEMKLVKSDWRSCLRPEVMSDLLFVMFHTAEVKDFDPTDAINLWNTSGRRVRRPSQAPYGSRHDEEEDDTHSDVWTPLDPDYLDTLNI